MTTPAQPDPAAQLRAAAQLLRERGAEVPSGRWGNRPWHVEPCANPQTDDCPCIIAQGDRAVAGKPGYPRTVEYIGDGETPEYARWIALMHLGVAEPLAAWLEREAEIWDQCETSKAEWHAKGFKLSWGINTHAEALAVARALLGSSDG